ncbi:uncharacterized protein BO97DRAFT_481227 [Aspergillus homomorphus CBS 101889]|uniref:Uncharacterized protein n=1 Tax=Aspergillus homomorphus (strain CBS 101889) TaxID=1450537 RepID=A0A395HMK4_ASPHC|nr:hypothetical protein BO97DRAFT_481227 [Aspergillus homomorphus CBS 101889]RAL07504.1 hypothetical protein BO97DRAFT_481227 [Aspergillus homomorphus CBS 101889]
MPTTSPQKRIILEKSRTVRRRYQRSNKRLQFTASQIARIEREQERERRAQQLRDRDRKRIANKKKKAEKEARDREERRRLGIMGLPDPNAPVVPSSQPSLFRFIRKPAAVGAGAKGGVEGVEGKDNNDGDSDGSDGSGGSTEFEDLDLEGWESETVTAVEDVVSDTKVEQGKKEGDDLGVHHVDKEDDRGGAGDTTTEDEFGWIEEHGAAADEDEFSDCSIFDDGEIIQRTAIVATDAIDTKDAIDTFAIKIEDADTNAIDTLGANPKDTLHAKPLVEHGAIPDCSASDSFQDDTALLLEELGHEFDADDEFEQALVALDAV